MSVVLNTLARQGARYALFSSQRPHLSSATTACGILTTADLTCQATLQYDEKNGIDWVRTAGLGVFACWHYGVPCKYLYLAYDRVIGTAPTLRTAGLKVLFDVYIHAPFLLVPSFYYITGSIKGQNFGQIREQLQKEWLTASFGTVLFWTPLCLFNFRFVPQHSRILFVSFGSFVHKTWISWLSNRARHLERLAI